MKEMVKRAYDNNEIVKLLLGEEPYTISSAEKKGLPIAVPADIDLRIHYLERLYENGQTGVAERLKEAIERLLDGDPFAIWTAYNATIGLLLDEHRGESPFPAIAEPLAQQVRNVILRRELELSETSHMFYGRPVSYMRDIRRMDGNFLKTYGVSVLQL